MRTKQKFLALIMSLMMILSIVPTTAFAVGEEDDPGEGSSVETAFGTDVFPEAVSNLEDGGEIASGAYQLQNNVTLETNLIIPAGNDVTIDLNGHTLKGNGSGSVITVNGTLRLKDSTAREQIGLSSGTEEIIDNQDGSWTVTYAVYDKDDNGTYNMYTAGAVTGGVGSDNGIGGGIHVAGGTVVMDDGIITGNKTAENIQYALGGGIYLTENSDGVYGEFTMNGGAVSGNYAYSSVYQGSGAGLYVDKYCTFTMNGGVFCHNTANGEKTSSAGAVYVQANGSFTAENAIFSNNSAGLGGVFYADWRADTTLRNCALVNNRAVGLYGGAIAAAHLTAENCVISHNAAATGGGGVYISGGADSVLRNCYIQYNSISAASYATYSVGGGGIATAHATEDWNLTIDGCTVRNNSITQNDCEKQLHGGGVYLGNHTVAEIENTQIINNTISGESVYGGGISMNSGKTTLTGTSEISGNTVTAAGIGGGIYIGANGTLQMEAGTISNNSAGEGGGITIGAGSGGITVFNMSGGAITGNTATGGLSGESAKNTGGGILLTHWSFAQCNLSGSAVISGNTGADGEANNLCLCGNHGGIAGILTAELGEDAEIGMLATGAVQNGRVILKGTDSYTIALKDLAHISYDGNDYAPYLDTDSNEIKLGTPITITFDLNGGTGDVTSQKVSAGHEAMLDVKAAPTLVGYIFTGWKEEDSDQIYNNGATITFSENKTLVAQWDACDHPNTTEATCTEPKVCNDCKEIIGAALGHSFSNYVYNNDATYERDGTKTAKCSRCDVTDTVTAEGTKLIYTHSGGSSSVSTGYPVTTSSGKNGTVNVTPRHANKGTTVTITVKPDKGYEVDRVTVTDKDGKSIKVTEGANNKYTFTMPSSKVAVEAVFAKIEEAPKQSFADVPVGYWAEDAIAWAAENSYINGNTAATFNPEGTVTRQQLWMILARLSGEQPADFAAAKDWAVSNWLTDGTTPGTAVSRQQLVTILYRYAVGKGYDTADKADLTQFPDHASVASYAADAMAWSVANSIVGGTTQGTLDPNGTATRAQFAVILSRFVDKFAA